MEYLMKYPKFCLLVAAAVVASATGSAVLATGSAPSAPGSFVLRGVTTAPQRADLLAHVPASRVQADMDGDGLFDDLAAELATAPADRVLDVIVRYKPGREPARIDSANGTLRRLELDHSVGTRLTAAEIRRLAASGDVESIETDAICHAARDTAEAFFGTSKASADFSLSGDGDGDRPVYSARDHTIAVIDTGIDGNHQDFRDGKIIAWQDFVNQRTAPYDDQGHGTHVASIAAGAVNTSGVGGVAPAAALVGLKALDSRGEGPTSRIAQAVDWCVTNKDQYGIQVINLSATTDASSSGRDALSRTLNRAVAAGIVVCVAAGNAGPDLYTIGSPAAAADVITVGDVADPGAGGFFLDPHSSRGPTADGRIKPDLCAPGDQILAARAGTRDGYFRASGTSMSSPFVAGVAALMLQANPTLTPADVKTILKETAVHFGPNPAGENTDFGAGRLDGYAALARAAAKTGTEPALPQHLSGSGHLQTSDDAQVWQLSVNDTSYPIAATLIMLSTGADFDLGIYDPSGRLVASSSTASRQEIAAFRPTRTGTYTVRVLYQAGSGDYWLDISAGSNAPLIQAE
jgi:serine protease AprX